MNDTNVLALPVDDLAGHWTERTLEILHGAGIGRITVDMEVEAWRTLKELLCSIWQRSLRSTPASLTAFASQTLSKAALSVAREFEPQSVSREFENRIDELSGAEELTANGAQRSQARRPALRGMFNELGRITSLRQPCIAAGGG
jgi:hypothetical protein